MAEQLINLLGRASDDEPPCLSVHTQRMRRATKGLKATHERIQEIIAKQPTEADAWSAFDAAQELADPPPFVRLPIYGGPPGTAGADEDAAVLQTPTSGQRVRVHYTGTLRDGTQFGDTRDNEQTAWSGIEFVMGAGTAIRGWEESAAEMQLGERCWVVISAGHAYGPAGLQDAQGVQKVPPDAPLLFDIEILAINGKKKPKPGAPPPLTAEQQRELEDSFLPVGFGAKGAGGGAAAPKPKGGGKKKKGKKKKKK